MDMNTILAAFNKITSESMGMAGGSHTAMDSGKKCSSCGNRIVGSGKTTEQGDVICADCDEHYAIGGPGEYEVAEAAMCEQCGQSPCQCESVNEGQCSKCGADPCVCESMSEGFRSELADIRRLAECGEMWAPVPAQAQATSGMNVTTNVDSKSGTKTVTVSADGAGAEELMRVLQMAGIAVAPMMSDMHQGMEEEVTNQPAPQTLDTQTVMNQGEDLNRIKGQFNGDRARDNSMTFNEDVTNVANSLRRQFMESKNSNKFDTWTIKTGGITYTLKELKKMGADASFIQDDADDPDEYAETTYVMDKNTNKPLIVKSKRINWSSFKDPNPEEDDEFNEDVTNVANSLRRQFMESKNSNKFDTWTVTSGGKKYTLKELKKMGADASFIQDDADDPDEYAETTLVMDKKTKQSLKVNGKTIKWTSFKDPNPEEDDEFNEDVTNVANSLRRQFMESKNSNKFDTWTIKTGGITYTLKELKKMGADASFIQDDADDPDEYAETTYVMDKNTNKPLIVKSKRINWSSFKDPNPEEDDD